MTDAEAHEMTIVAINMVINHAASIVEQLTYLDHRCDEKNADRMDRIAALLFAVRDVCAADLSVAERIMFAVDRSIPESDSKKSTTLCAMEYARKKRKEKLEFAQ